MDRPELEPDVTIQNVAFRPDGLIEITYTEARELTEEVAVVRTVMFVRDAVPAIDLDDLADSLQQLVDAALIRLRNPESTRTR